MNLRTLIQLRAGLWLLRTALERLGRQFRAKHPQVML